MNQVSQGLIQIVIYVLAFWLIAYVGRKYKFNTLSGWRLIFAGVLLLTFSSIVTSVNYFTDLRRVLGELLLAFSTGFTVYIVGLICILIGLTLVVPHLRELISAEEKAKRAERYSQTLEEVFEGKVKELDASKEKYRNLFHNARDAMFLVSEKGTYLDVNNAACEMLGYSRKELVGMKLKDTSPEVFELLNGIQGQERLPTREVVFAKNTGEKISAELSATMMMVGERKYYHGIVRDITGRKKLEEQLHEYTNKLEQKVEERTEELQRSEERYRNLFEYANDAIFVESLGGDILSANSKACELLQYSKDELLSLKLRDIVASEVVQDIPQFNRTIREKGSIIIEAKNRRKDGTLVDVEVSARFLKLNGDEVELVFVRDITDRKKTEEQVQMLAHMVESVSESISITDLDDNIVFVNDAFLRTYGYEKNEIIGKHIHVLRSATFSDRVANEILEQTLRGGWQGELMNVRRDGSAFPGFLSTSLIKDHSGKMIATVGIMRDITEQKKVQEEILGYTRELEEKNRELAVQTEKAEEANRTKSAFLSATSHDLRTPLNSVIGFAEIILADFDSLPRETTLEFVKNIHLNGKDLLNLINTILDLSKVEAGKMEPALTSFPLMGALENICALMRPLATEKGISLVLDRDPSIEIIVADQGKFKQIMFNLLSNAVKFSHPSSSIFITPQRLGDDVEISVQDEGIGIKKEDLNKLFQPFHQLDSSYAKHYEGSGLGLALTKRLIELHGGTIQVASEWGKGTTFTFTLPLRGPSKKASA
jgi:PAS domain S-box-containing protein